VDVIDHLLPPLEGYMHLAASTKHGAAYFIPEREVTIEELIIGALETAFLDMVISKHSEKNVFIQLNFIVLHDTMLELLICIESFELTVLID